MPKEEKLTTVVHARQQLPAQDGLEAPPEELPAQEGVLEDEDDLPIEDLMDDGADEDEEDLSLAALLRRRMQEVRGTSWVATRGVHMHAHAGQ